MLSVRLICVGKLKESFYIGAFEEYRKRLGAYCRFELEELNEQRLPERPSAAEIAAALAKEGAEIEKRLPPGAAVTALCIEGELKSSEQLARQLDTWAVGGRSRLCFVIGGSFGLAQSVKDRAELRLSMSPMTFPHHLARVMLCEQLYRAFNILDGGKYHK